MLIHVQRKTYTSRIDELDQMGLVRKNDGKALPARPESSEVRPSNEFSPAGDHMDDVVVIETATVTRIVKDNSLDTRPGGKVSPSPPQQQRVPSRQAQRTEPDRPRLGGPPANGTAVSRGTPSLTVSTSREQFDALSSLRQPMDSKYMPPPLSPRRPVSPAKANDPAGSEPTIRTDFSGPGRPYAGNAASVPFRNEEPQSTSWLDPDDDGGASPVSSVHSISPVTGIRRRHIRAPSGDTEAEFDAALDAAVEAAYDDGFEPMDPAEPMGPVEPLGPVEPVKVEDDDDVIARALRKVELAKERVRQTERELALEEERRRQMQRSRQQQSRPAPTDFYDGSDSEEEERLLEQITRGDITDVLSFSAQARPALPRQSDSSGTTNRTWHSSLVSNPPTATTTSSALSTVAELDSLPSIPKSASPLPPPPSQALPAPPPLAAAQGTQAPTQAAGVQGVRNRRLSGQPPAQLKIETARLGGPVTDIASAAPRDVPRPAERPRPPSRPASAGGNAGGRGGEPATPPTVDRASRDLEALAASAGGSESPTPASSARQAPYLRKVQSSTSLHSIRAGRNMSRTNLDETDGGVSDGSPGTPSSSHFGSTTRLPMLPNLPTPPPGSSFRDKLSSGSEAGFRLFEGGFHASDTAGSANPLLVDAPVPLEPCPTEALLRPFWLMRCLYQTLAHPRGGYLSSKLFVPKDVWKVKGVKIKNVEDKIASCDLLTAALQKLERVDTCDADAVLVEMQAFEEVVKQVRTTLSRKLGGEVGNQGLANTLFKDSSVSPDLDLATMVPRSASTASKSSSFSWRRLRSKNSAGGLGNTYGGGGGRTASGGDGQKEDMIVDTLPMTAHPTSRPPKRDVALAQFGGPHQNYMNSLARLFDAAQAVGKLASSSPAFPRRRASYIDT